LFTKCEILNQK